MRTRSSLPCGLKIALSLANTHVTAVRAYRSMYGRDGRSNETCPQTCFVLQGRTAGAFQSLSGEDQRFTSSTALPAATAARASHHLRGSPEQRQVCAGLSSVAGGTREDDRRLGLCGFTGAGLQCPARYPIHP